jgi:hypothetical protein
VADLELSPRLILGFELEHMLLETNLSNLDTLNAAR